LTGESKRLPNPHVFIRPFFRREAVLSSRIEGTQATFSEVLEYAAGGRAPTSEARLADIHPVQFASVAPCGPDLHITAYRKEAARQRGGASRR